MAKTTKSSYFDKLESDIKTNQSTLSLVLGVLIVLIVGVLLFNYINRNKEAELGPSQQISEEGDVSPGSLPGKYTVKEGDTLFLIAEKYYTDGYKYTEIAKANSLASVDLIETGQVLEIPKLATEVAEAEPTTQPSETPSETKVTAEVDTKEQEATGGGNTTIWGPKIEANEYTVVEGDWLSTIAARAYGDIMAYQKLAEANNLINPDLILPGQVLKIPR